MTTRLCQLLIGLLALMHANCSGQVVFEGPVASAILGTNRFVRIYLPPSYEREPARRFPVLYVHDGQNAFSTVGDDVAFGWGNWRLDRTVDELSAAHRMQEIILVAVDCSPERYLDYRGPARPARAGAAGDDRRFADYTRFLLEELKPKIDHDYRTRADAANTGVLGSSMGGLCSLALAWEHPEVFGRAASFSGAFQVEKRYFLKNVLGEFTGKPKPVRLYLDSGTVDYSGGDDGRRDTDAVAAELRRLGWRDGKTLLHFTDLKPLTDEELARTDLRRDKWPEARTSQHNEFYWRLRAGRALEFLFPSK